MATAQPALKGTADMDQHRPRPEVSLAAQALAVAGVICVASMRAQHEGRRARRAQEMVLLAGRLREVQGRLSVVERQMGELEQDTRGLSRVETLLFLGGLGPRVARARHKRELAELDRQAKLLAVERGQLQEGMRQLLRAAARDLIVPRLGPGGPGGEQDAGRKPQAGLFDKRPRGAWVGWSLEDSADWYRLPLLANEA